MTAVIPVLDPMNGSDHPPALPLSATRGSALKFSDDLTEIIAIWVAETAVAKSSAPLFEASDQRKLMLSMASGSQAAFGLIYDQLCVPTFAICKHYLKSSAAVDEAMCGLWLYVWQNAAMLSGLDGSPCLIIIGTAERHAEYCAQTERLARGTDLSLPECPPRPRQRYSKPSSSAT